MDETIEGQVNTDEEAAFSATMGDEAGTTHENEVAAPAPAPTPEIAQPPLTEDRVAELMAAREAEMRKQIDKAFGTIGNLQQELTNLKQSAITGAGGEITDEDVADLASDYPELAEAQLKVLRKIAPKMRGISAPAGVDEGRLQAAVDERLQRMQVETLEADHPDWKAVAGSTEFKSWVKTLPVQEQATLDTTWNARLISNKLKQFKAQQSAIEAKKPSPRQNRFAAAIQPRSSGGHGNYHDPNSEEAGFASAFAGAS